MTRRKTRIVPRLLAVALACALAVPNPIFALRDPETLEKKPVVLSGLEEALRGDPKQLLKLASATSNPSPILATPAAIPTVAPAISAAGMEEDPHFRRLNSVELDSILMQKLSPDLQVLIQRIIIPGVFGIGVTSDEQRRFLTDTLVEKLGEGHATWSPQMKHAFRNTYIAAQSGKPWKWIPWIHAYILLPQGVALALDTKSAKVVLIPAFGYELHERKLWGATLVDSLPPIAVIYTQSPPNFEGWPRVVEGWADPYTDSAYVNIMTLQDRDLQRLADIRAEELSHVRDYNRLEHEMILISQDGVLNQYIRKFDKPAILLLEIRANLRQLNRQDGLDRYLRLCGYILDILRGTQSASSDG